MISDQSQRHDREIAGELWIPVPGLDGYEASDHGRIRSLDRRLEVLNRWGQMIWRFHHGKIIKLKVKPNGYRYFYAGPSDEWPKWAHANRVVCTTFHGQPPSDEHEAAHLDRDLDNNRPDNLVWATPLENAAHKFEHGTNPAGEKNGCAKLKATDIPQIIKRYCEGENGPQLAKAFGVSQANIIMIVSRKTWKSIAVDPALVIAAQTQAKVFMFEAPRAG